MTDATPDWAGPLRPLLRLPGVTDVLLHAPGQAWIDRGMGLERVPVDVPDADALRALAVTLAAVGGRRLDDASPAVDARLPDGARLHAVLPPICPDYAAISLRTVRPQAFTLDDLETCAMVTGPVRHVLERVVERRLSVLVSGATGSGKSSLLATLLSLVPAYERIVVIEEAGELRPDHPHVVRLVERRPNAEGAGEVTLAQLVREALRMRPDRLVLGECRGAELREVLLAFNTGHAGGATTVHANGTAEVPERLIALGTLAGLEPATVERQAAIAFDVVVHVERTDVGRQVVAISMLEIHGGRLEAVDAVRLHHGQWTPGPAWRALEARVGHIAGDRGALSAA